MRTFFRSFKCDDGKQVEVYFGLRHVTHSCQEINIKGAWLEADNNVTVVLSDNESERFEVEVAAAIWDYVE